ncbi:molybdopterin-dependent oxidoreductase [Shewanella eurypsychrophilus]|uniref:Molybdopterin-dependent oxidoreductase n=1 Tax=Shewanella eurypsychrophilus TaxID=2593656 RepID=A0ABX6V164_9GAMM|nr:MULTISPECIES: molybdopterin-dependent oxidoreductase [Shewanella]QFU20686.1 molybdopterin-dependent oxidoreductase [Shewanella sp. YLB-09]QFU20966.1 molybdopterin-dependent oxidoreductase [Shewanella sp. YLB-09]QPG56254.1 molybdopterin-dependent oxidoreductase [Shewanella eurypsychrophilus]
MKRRDFLKVSAASAAVASVTGCSSDSAEPAKPIEQPITDPIAGESHAWAQCQSNCWAWCPLKVITKDGKIIRIEPHTEGDDNFDSGFIHNKACAKGLMLKELVYSPERLTKPLKRVGKRGEGKFEEISWEQAASEIAQSLRSTIDSCGNRAVMLGNGSGAAHSSYPIMGPHVRLMNLLGGFQKTYGYYSACMKEQAIPYTFGPSTKNLAYGQGTGSSSVTEMKHSDYILSFGYNPLEMFMTGGGEGHHFAQTLESNDIKFVYVDPRYTDTCLGREDDWLGIRPGTDGALIEAIFHQVLVAYGYDSETNTFADKRGNWANTAILGLTNKSLEEYKTKLELELESGEITDGNAQYAEHIEPEDNLYDYIMGTFTGKAKTPEWAAPICGVPAGKIREVAQDLLSADAPFICSGQGIQRNACGEQVMRAIYTLPVLLNAIGRRGTNNGDLPMVAAAGPGAAMIPMAFWSDPTVPGFIGGTAPASVVKAKIPTYKTFEAMVRGHEMTERSDGVLGMTVDSDTPENDEKYGTNIKFLMTIAGNTVNQHGDIEEVKKVLSLEPTPGQKEEPGLDMHVVIDTQMTPTAQWADIVLPDTTWTERYDYIASDNTTVYTVPSIEPIGDSKPVFEFLVMLAEEMGVTGFATKGLTQEAMTKTFIDEAVNGPMGDPTLPHWSDHEEHGYVFTHKFEEPSIGMEKEFNQRGGGVKLSTPSTLVEAYSPRLAWIASDKGWDKDEEYVDGGVTALPKYLRTWEDFEDQDAIDEGFEFQLVNYHTKGRAHSTFHNCPTLRKVYEDAIWINPYDANNLGIISGEMVDVASPRGTIEVPAKVTTRIAMGVVAIGQGAWHKKLGNKDVGGCANTLTRQKPTPLAKGNPMNSVRVRITKA